MSGVHKVHMLSATALVVLLTCGGLQAGTWYVSADAAPGGDGLSWGTAYSTIQAGIDSCVNGDEVVLADGVYSGEGNRDLLIDSLAITVRSANGPEQCVVQCEGSAEEPHRGFLITWAGSGSTVLNGLTIRGGYGPGVDLYSDGHLISSGGGVYCVGGSPELQNCVFEENQASCGAGVLVMEGLPEFSDCIFLNNVAGRNGGGLGVYDCSLSQVDDCVFAGNCASCGGGYYGLELHSGTVEGCTFRANSSVSGGGIAFEGNSSPAVQMCLFAENIAIYGGGVFHYDDSSPVIENTQFLGNAAVWGGAVFNTYECSPTLTNCTLLDNLAEKGSGMYSRYTSYPVVTNTILWDRSWVGDVRPVWDEFDSATSVTFSCVQGGRAGAGNIQSDPMIAFLDHPDYPAADSPCVDAGTATPAGGLPATDAAGGPRVLGSGVDMGAYEVEPNPILDVEVDQVRMAGWVGEPAATTTFGVRNRGTGSLNWSASASEAWVVLTPAAGVSSGEVDDLSVEVDVSGMAPGQYAFTVTVQNESEPSESLDVQVVLSVGQVRNVAPGGSGTYATIQDAIDAALPGDLALCSPGTYSGEGNRDISFRGKAIVVRGAGGAESCVIECGGYEGEPHRGFVFSNHETRESVLDGFTIRDGYQTQGGGIVCKNASPTIENCLFTDNFATDKGGGLMAGSHSDPLVTGCVFDDNTAEWIGGGMAIDNSSPVVEKCSFIENSARTSGGFDAFRSDPVLTNCVFEENVADLSGGAIGASGSEMVVRGCLLSGNRARNIGGGMFNSLSDVIVTNCTIVGNRSNTVSGGIHNSISTVTVTNTLVAGNFPVNRQLLLADLRSEAIVTYSSIAGGWEGEGNVDIDPEFVFDGVNSRLMPGSACINAGTDSPAGGLPEYDLDGTVRGSGGGVDIGAYEYDPAQVDPVLSVNTESVRMIAYGQEEAEPVIVKVRNGGSGTLIWNASADVAWLGVSPASGTSNGEIDEMVLTVDRSGLAAGTYSAVVEVHDASHKETPFFVDVSVVIGGSVIHVEADGSGDYATIQAAIDASQPGDVVLCGNGTYTGEGNRELRFFGKPIAVRGSDAELCVLDCEDLGRGFRLIDGEGPETRIEKITILNGSSSAETIGEEVNHNVGGGILCWGSSPTFIDCRVTDCSGSEGGGAMCQSSTAVFKHCVFSGNSALSSGGGVMNRNSQSQFIDCEFVENRVWGKAGAGMANAHSSPLVLRCVFTRNENVGRYGGGMWNRSSSPCVADCLFHENSSFYSGGGIHSCGSSSIIQNCTFVNNSSFRRGVDLCGEGSYSTIVNCIFWATDPELPGYDLLRIELLDSYDTVSYSTVMGGSAGEGNLESDPMLDANFRLTANSPCIDAGTITVPGGLSELDVDQNPRVMGYCVDMGAHEFVVDAAEPSMKLMPGQIRFLAKNGTPSPRTVEILNTGGGTLAWSAVSDADWLTLSPASGRSREKSQCLTLRVDIDGLEAGVYSGTVTVTAPEAGNSPKTVDVELYVGRTIRVEANGSGDYPTIQAAVDAAIHGDTILCGNGTYTGEGNRDIVLDGKAITLRGEHGSGACIIDCEQGARGFLLVHGESRETVLDGLTVKNAQADSREYDRYDAGGGVLIAYADPLIRNCRFERCSAEYGGCLFAYCACPIIENCVLDLSWNSLQSDYSMVQLSECTFQNNSNNFWGYQGAITNYYSWMEILDCRFVDNSTSSMRGIGCAITNEYSTMILDGSEFKRNVARGYTSTIWNAMSDVDISRCRFLENGGLSYPLYGGAICNVEGTSAVITNSVFGFNQADESGGAIYNEFCESISIVNCTFANNRARYGYGGAVYSFDTPVSMANCIFWGNYASDEPDSVFNLYGEDTITWSCIEGGWPGAGNIDVDPQFVNTSPEDQDYRLDWGSPCIDAGNNTLVRSEDVTDLLGLPRFLDDPSVEDTGVGEPPIVDMGAIEYRLADGDRDGDGDVDLEDFAAFQACYGSTEISCLEIFDLEPDNVVNQMDYVIFNGILSGPAVD